MLKEIKKENLSKTIIKALGEYIIVNNLKSGDRLPTEKVLAEEFKVGRNVVREAIKALETIGIVNSKPGIGTVLSSDGVKPFLLPFIFGIVLEDSDLTHIAELRLTLEVGAARQAVLLASDEELEDMMILAKELDALKTKFELNESEIKDLALKENNFHKKLLELSHNPINEKFGHLWCIFFSRVRDTGELSRVHKAGKIKGERVTHEQIVEAIMSRDEDAAAKLIKTHMSYWLQQNNNVSKEMMLNLLNDS